MDSIKKIFAAGAMTLWVGCVAPQGPVDLTGFEADLPGISVKDQGTHWLVDVYVKRNPEDSLEGKKISLSAEFLSLTGKKTSKAVTTEILKTDSISPGTPITDLSGAEVSFDEPLTHLQFRISKKDLTGEILTGQYPSGAWNLTVGKKTYARNTRRLDPTAFQKMSQEMRRALADLHGDGELTALTWKDTAYDESETLFVPMTLVKLRRDAWDEVDPLSSAKKIKTQFDQVYGPQCGVRLKIQAFYGIQGPGTGEEETLAQDIRLGPEIYQIQNQLQKLQDFAENTVLTLIASDLYQGPQPETKGGAALHLQHLDLPVFASTADRLPYQKIILLGDHQLTHHQAPHEFGHYALGLTHSKDSTNLMASNGGKGKLTADQCKKIRGYVKSQFPPAVPTDTQSQSARLETEEVGKAPQKTPAAGNTASARQ